MLGKSALNRSLATATGGGVSRAACRGVWAAALAAIVVLSLALLPAAAIADGDPASDLLLSQSVFLPSDTRGSPSEQAELTALLRSAKRAGFPIRVAVIPSSYDLGSVFVLWRKPRLYAQLLGIELSGTYTRPLLVAMPNGFGFYWDGHTSAAAYRALASVPIASGGGGELEATQRAVVRLADQAGIKLSAPSSTSATSATHVEIVVPALVVILIAFALVRVTRRRRKRAAAPTALTTKTAKAARPSHAPAWSLRWVAPGVALLLCVAIGVPIVILRLRNANAVAATAPQSAPFTWPADQRPAPTFNLTDQAGRPISLSAYRGRPVILTFIDPLCRNLCPLAAQVLNQADRQLPASQRPAIIAVSIDVYADTRADLYEDFSKWRLVPQWQWAVGKPAALAAVWRNYKIGVLVQTKQIADTTIHEITHDEVAYVIDPDGYERALFVWPYYPQDVDHTLRQLLRS